MLADQKRDLKRRAQFVLSRPVPAAVCNGSALDGRLYREDAAVLAAFVRRGVSADKAFLAVHRLESVLCVAAPVLACDASGAAAAAAHTPPSNTGVNEVSGSGRGLERGYARAAARLAGMSLSWS